MESINLNNLIRRGGRSFDEMICLKVGLLILSLYRSFFEFHVPLEAIFARNTCFRGGHSPMLMLGEKASLDRAIYSLDPFRVTN